MHVSLVIPGLLWPEPVLSDTVRELHLPALQALLGRGRRARAALNEAAHWDALFKAPPPAAAPLRLLDGGLDPGAARWVCLDPVSLVVDQQGIRLGDPAKLVLDETEIDALGHTLAALLSDFPPLLRTSAGWHVRLSPDTALPFPPLLADLVGLPARDLLPPGDTGKPWRRRLNEIQMALHEHPLNQARAGAGLGTVGSFVLWGAGALASPNPLPCDFSLASPSPVLRGRARHAGAAAKELPAGYPLTSGAGTSIFHLTNLDTPTRLRDALGWRQALTELEETWIAPALAALAAGRIHSLTLHGFGEDTRLSVRLDRHSRWKFWCRPAQLSELHP